MVIEPPIISQRCEVKFNSFTPTNLENYPFIAIVSKGIHHHLPPPPVTLPTNVLEQLNKIIENEDVLNLTARKLCTGKLYLEKII
jgi:hypothetical protein